jgi:sporulation protein YlmC with PRC-barrel domain
MKETTKSSRLEPREESGHVGIKDSGSHLCSVCSLLGNKVLNPQGRKLGVLRELMLDTGTAGIRFAVLGTGGFLGFGERLHAVPWSALSLNASYRHFILDVPEAAFDRALGFDRDEWPNMNDPAWSRRILTWYDTHAATTRSATPAA